MAYVDGFVVPVPKKNVAAYGRMARKAGKIWIEHGAIEFRECVAEETAMKFGLSFAKAFGLKPSETVMFSWITYKSKAHRNRVNAKVMADPRLKMDPENMPFDAVRMVWGGFKPLVSL